MRKKTRAPYRPTRHAWLIGCALCLSMWVAWGQDGVAQWASQASVDKTQKGLQQLSRQIGQLRSTAAQDGLRQKKQNESLQQQIDGLEHGQDALSMQLAELQQQILQQVSDIQDNHRQLVVALWSLAILAGLLMLMLLWIWLYRRTPQPSKATPAPLPAPQADVRVSKVELGLQAAPDHRTAKADTAKAASRPSNPEQPMLSTADLTGPWSDKANADLHNMHNALNQARQGFMRTAHIEP